MTPMTAALFVVAFITTVVLATTPQSCPTNLVQKAQTCFTDLARAVHSGSNPNTKIADTAAGMTMDYTQIKKYCAENGHMSKFVDCIEGLVSSCEKTPQSQLLERLVSPERVKLAVPSLCAHQNEIEASSQCMNTAMSASSDCKAKSYAQVKTEMSSSSRNATAMFLIQCTFFHSLAECQRKTVSQECGANLGDLHANFLLSFVPTSCIDGLVTLTSYMTSKPNVTSTTAFTETETPKTTKAPDVEMGTSEVHSLEQQEEERKTRASPEGIDNETTSTDPANRDIANGGRTLWSPFVFCFISVVMSCFSFSNF